MAAPDDHPIRRPDAGGPAVLAVVVAHDPGPWFEECLQALADQDHPRCNVLVLDAGEGPGDAVAAEVGAGAGPGADEAPPASLAARVARVLPDARVERVAAAGFGEAANTVLERGVRAPLLCFLHDDVALAPDALSTMAATLVDANAGIVGPKLVEWDDPTRLLQVGLEADRYGVTSPVAEPGELDQQQHDTVRDAFVVPGGATLVRADLFRAVGGYDPGITLRGDDTDLCWRAQLAGARVMVVPEAVARHRWDLDGRRGGDELRALRSRHEIRTVLGNSSLATLTAVLPMLVAISLVEAGYDVARGRFGRARQVLAGWGWNLRRLGQIRAKRRAVRTFRQVGDREVHRRMLPGSARLRLFVRGQIADPDSQGLGSSSRDLARSLRARAGVPGTLLLAATVLVALVGSRHIVTRPIVEVGELQPFALGPRGLLAEWWRGWRGSGGGTTSAAPTADLLLGVSGLVTLGRMALLRTLLVVGPLVVGPFGMWRLVRPFGSSRARAAAVVLYLAVPVPWNALAEGSWSALVVYGAAPWLLATLATAMDVAPWRVRSERGAAVSMPTRVLACGVLVALVAAAVPVAAVLVVVVAVAFALGSLCVGQLDGVARVLRAGVGGAVVAAVLHGPWAWSLVDGGWHTIVGPGAAIPADGAVSPGAGDVLGLGALVRFGAGPLDGRVLGYGLVLGAGLTLLVAHGARLAWAVRGWFVALACWGVLWSAGRGWLPVAVPPAGVLQALAAAALVLAAVMGVLAVEVDLPRQRLGWRQGVVALGAVALAAGLVVFVGGAANGRWSMPRQDFHATYSLLDTTRDAGAFRTLWLADPAVLPVGARPLDEGLGVAVVADRPPSFEDRWVGPPTPVGDAVVAAVDTARRGDTARLGRLLAPYGVRYLVLPERLAPEPFSDERRPLPDDLVKALATQLDLERVQGLNPAVTIYRNNAWFPVVATLPADVAAAATAPGASAASVRVHDAAPVLGTDASSGRADGPVAPGTAVWVGQAAGRWDARADGNTLDAVAAFGGAGSVVTTPAEGSGQVHLAVQTGAGRRAVLAAQLLVWLGALVLLGRWREREVRGRTRTRRGRVSAEAALAATVPAGTDAFAGEVPARPAAGRVDDAADAFGWDLDPWTGAGHAGAPADAAADTAPHEGADPTEPWGAGEPSAVEVLERVGADESIGEWTSASAHEMAAFETPAGGADRAADTASWTVFAAEAEAAKADDDTAADADPPHADAADHTADGAADVDPARADAADRSADDAADLAAGPAPDGPADPAPAGATAVPAGAARRPGRAGRRNRRRGS